MKTLKFSVRDLFWLVLVAAMAVGWCVEHMGFEERMKRVDGKLSSWPTKPGEVLNVSIDDDGGETITFTWPGETIIGPGPSAYD